jgi:hypothetical protein
MKKGAWRYFRPGDDILDIVAFIEEAAKDAIDTKTQQNIKAQPLTKKIRIVIDIFEDEN